jgi:hypothetical protein
MLNTAAEEENLSPQESNKAFGHNHFTLSDAVLIGIRYFAFKLNKVLSVLYDTVLEGLSGKRPLKLIIFSYEICTNGLVAQAELNDRYPFQS